VVPHKVKTEEYLKRKLKIRGSFPFFINQYKSALFDLVCKKGELYEI